MNFELLDLDFTVKEEKAHSELSAFLESLSESNE